MRKSSRNVPNWLPFISFWTDSAAHHCRLHLMSRERERARLDCRSACRLWSLVIPSLSDRPLQTPSSDETSDDDTPDDHLNSPASGRFVTKLQRAASQIRSRTVQKNLTTRTWSRTIRQARTRTFRWTWAMRMSGSLCNTLRRQSTTSAKSASDERSVEVLVASLKQWDPEVALALFD